MSMTEKQFERLIKEIQEQGFSEETAAGYAMLIGDTPVYDKAGMLLVMDGKKIVARLKALRFFAVAD